MEDDDDDDLFGGACLASQSSVHNTVVHTPRAESLSPSCQIGEDMSCSYSSPMSKGACCQRSNFPSRRGCNSRGGTKI